MTQVHQLHVFTLYAFLLPCPFTQPTRHHAHNCFLLWVFFINFKKCFANCKNEIPADTLNTSYTKHCFGKYATNFTLLQFKCMLYQLEQANTKKKPMQQFLTKKELCCLVKPLALSWLDPTQQQKIRVRLIPFYFPWISIFFGRAISLLPLCYLKQPPHTCHRLIA